MLDSFTGEQQRTQTDRLSVPLPEKTPILFDPKKDLAPEDWEGMINRLEYYREKDWGMVIYHACDLKILDPNIDLRITDTDKEEMKKCLMFWRGLDDCTGFASLASSLKILDPGTDWAVTDTGRKKIKTGLDALRGNDWYVFTALASYLKILDPTISLGITNTDKEEMISAIETYRAKDWKSFASLASSLKILDPTINLGITDTDKEEMKNTLRGYREQQIWDDFVSLASDLMILSASNIVFDSQGMHLVFEEEKGVVENIPPVPRTL